MKKATMILVFMMFFYSFTHAQLDKGKVAPGGSVGFSFQSQKSNSGTIKNNSISFLPSIDVFVKDKLCVWQVLVTRVP